MVVPFLVVPIVSAVTRKLEPERIALAFGDADEGAPSTSDADAESSKA